MSYYSNPRYNPSQELYEASTLIGPNTGKRNAMRAQNQYRVTIQPTGSWPAFEVTLQAATQYRAELLGVQQYRADYAASGCQPPSIASIQCEELTPTSQL